MLNLSMRKVKGTSYKIVLSGWDIIGIFEREKFYSKKGMTSVQKEVATKFHADIFKEKFSSLGA